MSRQSDVAAVDDPLYFALCLSAHDVLGELLLQCDMYTNYEASDGNADRAIGCLAEESQVPVDVVARLYKAERIRLEGGARITGFISILAIRNVRKLLRRSGDTPVIFPAATHPHRIPA